MKFVIVDIDGVLVDLKERLPYFKDPNTDWEAYYKVKFNDQPISNVVELVKNLKHCHVPGFAKEYKVIFCTGRSERDRSYTEMWLRYQGLISFDFVLLMRPDGDERPDSMVKPQLLSEYFKKSGYSAWSKHPIQDVAFILEDRNSMVAKWRELGYTVLQPALGDF